MPDPLTVQNGVLRARQAVDLFGREVVRHRLRSGRWQRPWRGVVVIHNGELTDVQQAWVALFACPPGSALGGRSALAFDGFEGVEDEGTVVVLPEGAARPAYERIVPHFSTMLAERDVHPLRLPRRTRVQRSPVDYASWQRAKRRARVIILAGIQQRLTRTRDLHDALTRRGPCRHRAVIVESTLDAAGGIQSLPERDFDAIRVGLGLPTPTRQAVARRTDGKYHLDVAWRRYDTACEIHGIPHMRVAQWDADLLRSNEITIAGPRLLVFSSYAIRHERAAVGDQLQRMLRRGGWNG